MASNGVTRVIALLLVGAALLAAAAPASAQDAANVSVSIKNPRCQPAEVPAPGPCRYLTTSTPLACGLKSSKKL